MDVFLVVVIIVAVFFYFLPILIALARGLASAGPLFFVNLFFGWTLIGWFVCLLWAAIGATKAQDDFYRVQATAAGVPPDRTDPLYREAYARERARLDHLAATAAGTAPRDSVGPRGHSGR